MTLIVVQLYVYLHGTLFKCWTGPFATPLDRRLCKTKYMRRFTCSRRMRQTPKIIVVVLARLL